jgi:SNF2 family DNA or RNA helicase
MTAESLVDAPLHMNPQGHLIAHKSHRSSAWGKAFSLSQSEGLWALANLTQTTEQLLQYWRSFSILYLTQLAERQTRDEETERQIVPAPEAQFTQFIERRPAFEGAEYLTLETLQSLWQGMNNDLATHLKLSNQTPAAWLESLGSRWSLLGRVCLRLAENKRSETQPFAFLATIALQVTAEGKVLHTPLGRALQQAEIANDRGRMIHILKPLSDAASHVPWLAEILERREIFSPQLWTPAQAHEFLKATLALEQAGLKLQIPNWWKQGANQVKAKISVDIPPGKRIGAEALLQFNASIALQDEDLTEEEIQDLLAGEEGLVCIRGRWVEFNKSKIEQALAHWRSVSKEVEQNGLSWHQGMRFLSNPEGIVPLLSRDKNDTTLPLAKEIYTWSEVSAGKNLAGLLESMRSPQDSLEFDPGSALKATLRPYQRKGLAWLGFLSSLGLGACLADDMGLGKTIQVLALLLFLKQQTVKVKKKSAHRTLLIAPASLLSNWLRESEKFTPDLNIYIDHKSFQNDLSYDDADIILTTYASLIRTDRHHRSEWNLLILDEAQAIKTPHTAQTKAVKTLKAKARIALTGTPIENRLTDLWSLFDFLNPGLLGTQEEFRSFASPKTGEPRLDVLRQLTQPYILRRLKTDRTVVSDLPDKTENIAWCSLSKSQTALYQATVYEFEKALEKSSGVQRRGLVLSYLMRFKQICNHPDHAQGSGDFLPELSGKYHRLQELCEEIVGRQEKLLVFTQYREMCLVLAQWMRHLFGRDGLVLDGSTQISKRRKLVDSFQTEDGPPFFILSLKAGGSGLTLTEANHVIHFDRWWNPAVEDQATDRAFRIGQHRNVLVHKFVCRGTLEERVDEMITAKRSLSRGVLAAGEEEVPLTELSNDELLKLVKLDLATVNDSD